MKRDAGPWVTKRRKSKAWLVKVGARELVVFGDTTIEAVDRIPDKTIPRGSQCPIQSLGYFDRRYGIHVMPGEEGKWR